MPRVSEQRIKMNPSTPHNLPPELVRIGIEQLASLRLVAMTDVTKEMQACFPSFSGARTSCHTSEAQPWMLACFTAAALPNGGVCWNTLQEAFAERTAQLLKDAPIDAHATGGSLAAHLQIDVMEFSREGWANLEQFAPSMNQESL